MADKEQPMFVEDEEPVLTEEDKAREAALLAELQPQVTKHDSINVRKKTFFNLGKTFFRMI